MPWYARMNPPRAPPPPPSYARSAPYGAGLPRVATLETKPAHVRICAIICAVSRKVDSPAKRRDY